MCLHSLGNSNITLSTHPSTLLSLSSSMCISPSIWHCTISSSASLFSRLMLPARLHNSCSTLSRCPSSCFFGMSNCLIMDFATRLTICKKHHVSPTLENLGRISASSVIMMLLHDALLQVILRTCSHVSILLSRNHCDTYLICDSKIL